MSAERTALSGAPMSHSPEDPVAAARRGAPEGIAALYHAHAPGMLRLAWRLTGSTADAEDAVHDVFVGLPELLRRYDERGRLGAWLRGVTARLVLDRRRRERQRADLLARSAADSAALAPDPSASLDSHLALDLTQALAQLPLGLRTVFVLRHLEEQGYDEIAAHLDITPGAARVRYLRALRRLRSLMETDR